MFSTFWETMLGGQSKEWNLNVFLPPLLFWGGGLYVWCQTNKWSINILWDKLQYLVKLDATVIGFSLFLLISLMLVSNRLAGWFQFPLIRLIEGYWPSSLSFLEDYLVKRLESEKKLMEEEWGQLADKYEENDESDRRRYIKLETKLERYPSSLLLPTMFGNIFRAAEEYPMNRYGLETTRVWPVLWLLIPDKMREELIESNKVLYDRVTLFFWFSMFSLWTVIAFIEWDSSIRWPLIVSIFGIFFVYYFGLIPAVSNFGDLLRTSFDLHRFTLYEALHLPLPSYPNFEEKDGKNLSQYLKRGVYPASNVTFTHAETKTETETKSFLYRLLHSLFIQKKR